MTSRVPPPGQEQQVNQRDRDGSKTAARLDLRAPRQEMQRWSAAGTQDMVSVSACYSRTCPRSAWQCFQCSTACTISSSEAEKPKCWHPGQDVRLRAEGCVSWLFHQAPRCTVHTLQATLLAERPYPLTHAQSLQAWPAGQPQPDLRKKNLPVRSQRDTVITSNGVQAASYSALEKGRILVKRRSTRLLRNLATGLTFCGYSAVRISWRRLDDWYHRFSSGQSSQPPVQGRPGRR